MKKFDYKNFKRTINEELRQSKVKNEYSSLDLNNIMRALDECADSLEVELLQIELTESSNPGIKVLQDCLNVIHNTKNKLKKL